nr:small RNA 2'-O-methyltransferase isoform X1 [Tanacetum cinerariifolium]
ASLQRLQATSIKTLGTSEWRVDFGCGSWSLFNSLLDYPTSLERIVGVNISTKAFTRAAKMVSSPLLILACMDAISEPA